MEFEILNARLLEAAKMFVDDNYTNPTASNCIAVYNAMMIGVLTYTTLELEEKTKEILNAASSET